MKAKHSDGGAAGRHEIEAEKQVGAGCPCWRVGDEGNERRNVGRRLHRAEAPRRQTPLNGLPRVMHIAERKRGRGGRRRCRERNADCESEVGAEKAGAVGGYKADNHGREICAGRDEHGCEANCGEAVTHSQSIGWLHNDAGGMLRGNDCSWRHGGVCIGHAGAPVHEDARGRVVRCRRRIEHSETEPKSTSDACVAAICRRVGHDGSDDGSRGERARLQREDLLGRLLGALGLPQMHALARQASAEALQCDCEASNRRS